MDNVDELFNWGEGAKLRDEGIAKVISHNETWSERFFYAAGWLLLHKKEITSDDVVKACGMPPGHPSAVGASMRSFAKKAGLVKHGYIQSEKKSSHAAVIAVWRKPL